MIQRKAPKSNPGWVRMVRGNWMEHESLSSRCISKISPLFLGHPLEFTKNCDDLECVSSRCRHDSSNLKFQSCPFLSLIFGKTRSQHWNSFISLNCTYLTSYVDVECAKKNATFKKFAAKINFSRLMVHWNYKSIGFLQGIMQRRRWLF